MTDPNLLARATAAGARVADTEREVLLARADYHTAIRRLHLAGAPLREIAQALGLSHQRVQQIVSAAGGSWWQMWRRRRTAVDAICTWCKRPPSEVAKLIAGPKVHICDACVDAAERAIRRDTTEHAGLQRVSSATRQRCGFCGKRKSATRTLVTGRATACSDCLHVCREILDGRAV